MLLGLKKKYEEGDYLYNIYLWIKGTVRVNSSDSMQRWQSSIQNGTQPFSDQLCGRYCRFSMFQNFNFDKTYMLGILFIFGFKDTVVNRALSSLHGGQLEITLTVKSKMIFTLSLFKINCPTIAERDKCKYTGGSQKTWELNRTSRQSLTYTVLFFTHINVLHQSK